MIAPRLPAFEPPAPRAGGDRRRIGMVVNHGHEGIFIRSLQGVLPRLDRARFEIVVAVTRPALRYTQAALGDDGITWLALSPRVDQAADQLRAARLDLLYHWEVGSDSFNYFLPWFRLAPLQYTSWAWPLTMPGNMFTWAEPPRLADRPPSRADFGLSDNENLYLCHQNPRKIHPDFDPLVAEILERDPAGRLVLIGSQEGAETSPLLRGNFTSGLYRRMDLTGLIARDPDHYVDLALAIAGDPALREHWRATLRDHNGAIFRDQRAISELQDVWEIMLGGE